MTSDNETEVGASGEGTSQEPQEQNPLATVIEGASWVFGGRIVKLVLGFLVQILVARTLGTTSYGGLSLAMTVIGFAGLFAGLGVGRGVSRNVSYYEDEPAKARGIVRAGFVINVGSHLVTAAALFLLAPVIATQVFDNPELTLLIRIAAVGLPFGAVKGMGMSVSSGSRNARPHTIVNQVLGPLTSSLLVATLVLLGYGAVGAVVGRTVNTLLMTGVALWLAWRVFPIDIRGKTESMYRELLSFSLPLMFSGWMTYFIDETDYFILGIFHPENLVGIYTAMFGLRPMVLLFFFPATFLLSPVITRLQKQEDLGKARRTYQAVSKWTTLVSLPIFLLGFLFPRVVIGVTYGAEYLSGGIVLRLLMISGLVTVMLGANDRVVVGLGHSRVSMYVNGLAAGSNVVLNLLLIPTFGMIGAAVASVTAFATRNVVNSVLLYRWYRLTPFSPAMGKVFAALAVFVPIGYYGFVGLFPVEFLSVTAVGLVFLVFYVPIMIRLGGSEAVDEALILQVKKSDSPSSSIISKILG